MNREVDPELRVASLAGSEGKGGRGCLRGGSLGWEREEPPGEGSGGRGALQGAAWHRPRVQPVQRPVNRACGRDRKLGGQEAGMGVGGSLEGDSVRGSG